ncbi:hypothetical protein D9756_000229 [Leucocoprinus leucothites]|uniref:RNA polymerase I-specific transcription initiation factor RRN3 n=1 Tax=Leucocoprinus leucothites TaxID=201217 RepID=A0A8H5LN53_9AGAR|nr:hypothetical protein D9756_000229 [Leucoagaricus leucothites]
MDPHSRLNQFNHRGPKSGPLPSSRFVSEMPPKPSLSAFSSAPSPSTSTTKPKPRSNLSTSISSPLVRRPIASNSRIRQNESYRKDMYLAFVNNALQQKLEGNSQPFDELVDQFNPKRRMDPSSADVSTSLKTWILALTHVVSRLERTHSVLVEAIVNMPWTTLDSATVKSYTVFIGMLLSARPEYLSLVLGRIAQGFTYQSGIQTLSQAFPESSNSPVTRRVIYDRLHYLLQHLLSLIPTLPSTLQPLLVRHSPHKRQNQLTLTTYIRNLLRVSSYCPELSEKILAIIVDRAIQIDVEIQVELEELEEEEALEEQPIFDIDPFDVVIGQEEHDSSDLSDIDDADDDENGIGDDFSDLSSDAGGGLDDEVPLEISTNLRHIQDMVKKLDAILLLMFEHFQRTHTIASTRSTAEATEPGSVSRPPSPPELTPLPPLPSLSSDLPLLSSSTPIATPVYLQGSSQRASASEPPSTTPSSNPHFSSLQSSVNSMRVQFNALLTIFDRTILRTFKSRYTQFLIFWFTSLDPEFADVFQGMLAERALLGSSSTAIQPTSEAFNDSGDTSSGPQNTGGSAITRAAAASYIGSFVSRAVFVDGEGARNVVAVLCEFLKTHLDDVEESIRSYSAPIAVGGPQHTVFYAVTQAVFLIFCFRWRDLLDFAEDAETDHVHHFTGIYQDEVVSDGKSRKWMPELGVLQRVVSSVLNPLRVCSFNVVMQFARVAQATDFIYCYTILESNKRLEHAGTSGSTQPNSHSVVPALNQSAPSSSTILALNRSDSGTNAAAELNTFFPFDPYRLPRSAVFIRGVYREWSSVAIDNESDDENSDDDEEEETESGLGIPSSSPQQGGFLAIPRRDHPNPRLGKEGDTTGGLGESLEQMSISPRLAGVMTSTSVMSVTVDSVV